MMGLPRRRPYQYLVGCLLGLLVVLLYYYSITQLGGQPVRPQLLADQQGGTAARGDDDEVQLTCQQHHPYYPADIEVIGNLDVFYSMFT